MMRFFLISFVLLGCSILVNGAQAASEMEERAAIITSAKLAFRQGDFAQLEDMSRTYRTTKSRTPSGTWKLSMFYAGIGAAISTQVSPSGREAVFSDLENRAMTWAKRFPDSPSAHIMLSEIYIKHAWAYRGNEYADAVKPEAWVSFRKYISLAKQNLEAHKSVAAVDPAWYTTMISVARNESWERDKFDKLLSEALDHEPLFYATYFSALEYLLPKWHGGIKEIDVFAQNAVQRTSKEEGKSMYARIYWYASQSEFGNELFTESKARWPQMKGSFDDVIAQYPDAWNLNNYAKFACLAGDKPKAGELLKRIRPNIVIEAWEPQSLLQGCAKWALGK